MSTVEKWLTGLTTIAVVATVFGSQYSRGILDSLFGGVAKTYTAVKN